MGVVVGLGDEVDVSEKLPDDEPRSAIALQQVAVGEAEDDLIAVAEPVIVRVGDNVASCENVEVQLGDTEDPPHPFKVVVQVVVCEMVGEGLLRKVGLDVPDGVPMGTGVIVNAWVEEHVGVVLRVGDGTARAEMVVETLHNAVGVADGDGADAGAILTVWVWVVEAVGLWEGVAVGVPDGLVVKGSEALRVRVDAGVEVWDGVEECERGGVG